MSEIKCGLIAAARGVFTSWRPISLNRIVNRHETWYVRCKNTHSFTFIVISICFPFLRFRTSVERTDGSARTTQLVSLVLHRKDIEVCAQQDLRVTTVRMVTMLLLAYPCAHVNFYLAPTSLNIKHTEAEISIFTCASQHLKSPMFT